MAPKTTKYDAIKQQYDHDRIKDEFRAEKLVLKEKRDLVQLPESLYAIRGEYGKISKLAFLARIDFEAVQKFIEYLFMTREKKQDEVFILYRIGTYQPDKMTLVPEEFPIVIKRSDDSKKLILR